MLCCLQAGAALRGDVNGDNNVDVSDINIVINEVLGKGGTYNADVNGDGTTDVSDINIVINIILGKDEPEDNHEYVDLGLPSGTLWATCNVGGSKPEDYGLYFAWGETTGYAKDESHTFDWKNYKWCSRTYESYAYMTRYCTDPGLWEDALGTRPDNQRELYPEDDAATANWGSGWRMPTKWEQYELKYECTWIWTSNYNRSGVNGYEVKSKSNGNSIFLPAAGCRYDASLGLEGSYGFFWSSTLSAISTDAVYLSFNSSSIELDYYSRYFGRSVRAVRVKN